MLFEKLTKLFQTNPLIRKLAQFTQEKKVLFSSIVYMNHGKCYIIKKIQQTPYFEQDWQCYSFFRSYANTAITTGMILRTEKDLFKSYFACGDKDIQQMYANFRAGQKQNIYVMTRTMPRQQIMPYFNTDLYNVIEEDFVKNSTGDQKEDDLSKILKGIIRTNRAPVLIEGGPVIMKNYFESIRKGQCKNLIDGVFIAYFEGDLAKQTIGDEFVFDQNYFKEVWKSQKMNIQWKGDVIGTVYFRFFEGICS